MWCSILKPKFLVKKHRRIVHGDMHPWIDIQPHACPVHQMKKHATTETESSEFWMNDNVGDVPFGSHQSCSNDMKPVHHQHTQLGILHGFGDIDTWPEVGLKEAMREGSHSGRRRTMSMGCLCFEIARRISSFGQVNSWSRSRHNGNVSTTIGIPELQRRIRIIDGGCSQNPCLDGNHWILDKRKLIMVRCNDACHADVRIIHYAIIASIQSMACRE